VNVFMTVGRPQLRLGQFSKHTAAHPKLSRCSKTRMKHIVRFRMSVRNSDSKDLKGGSNHVTVLSLR